MLSLLLAASLVHGQDGPPPNPNFVRTPPRFVAGWRVDAETHVDRDQTPPVVENMECWARRAGLGVALWRFGGVSFDFGGATSPDGDFHVFDQRDARSIAIDGVVFEARYLDAGYLPAQFVDVAYSDPDPSSTYDPSLYGAYSGSLVMRRDADHPWMNVALVIDDLLQARALRLGYREEGDDGEESVAYQAVPLDGLREALMWCERWMTSDAARRLDPEPLTPP